MNNLELWNKGFETDPKYTKKMVHGAKLTSIDSYYRVQKATELFGPCGKGWGYEVEDSVIDGLFIAKISFWYEKREQSVIAYGTAPLIKGSRMDEDAPKKALTDGLTKAMSYIGICADVYSGKFEDDKYIQLRDNEERKKEEYTAPHIQVTTNKDLDPDWKEYATSFIDAIKETKTRSELKMLIEANKASKENLKEQDEELHEHLAEISKERWNLLPKT